MIGETAQLVVQLTLKDQLSGGVAKAEGQLGRLNTQAVASGSRMTVLATASGKAKTAMLGFGGALGHASSKIGGLLSGPLGLIGLTGGILGLGGAITSSISKVQAFGLGLEKIQGLTGETALSAGTLIQLFDKYGLGVDRVAQIAGFAEKTLGKLNATTAGNAKATKSATLQNLELVKAQRQAAGESTKAINKLISEQKAKDQIANAAAGQAASVTKLAALDKIYGLSLLDAKGKVVSFSQVLAQLAELYDRKNVPASTKAYVASQILGRGYAALIPILTNGSAAIAEASKEARALGLDQAGTAEKMVQFRDVMRNLGEQVDIVQMRIGLALVPAITDAAKAIGDWLGNGGDQQIVDFFKSGAQFAQEMGSAIETFIVPGFKAIAGAWGAIPGPLKDLLIAGFVANKAGKFLFDKSLFGGIGQLASGALQRGGTPMNPLFVQDVLGLKDQIPGPGLLPAAGAGGIGLAAMLATAAALTLPLLIPMAEEIFHKAGDPTVRGGRFGFYPGQTAAPLSGGMIGDFGAPHPGSLNFGSMVAAVALGTERGIVHSGVFRKAQAIREAGGFKLSIDALKADLKSKTPLGTNALITAEAIALAQGNRVRNDPTAADLKSASYNLKLLKRLQDHLPADLAAKLAPKIHSLEAAIRAGSAEVAAAIRAKSFGSPIVNQYTGFVTGGTNQGLSPVQRSQNVRGFQSGGIVPEDMLAKVHKGEFIIPNLHRFNPGGDKYKPGTSDFRWMGSPTALIKAIAGWLGGPGLEPIRNENVWDPRSGISKGDWAHGIRPLGNFGRTHHASGALGMTNGLTALGGIGVAGEAGQEAVAIVKHPKKLTAGQTAARVFVTNWPGDIAQTSTSGATTAQATTTIAKETVKAATQKQMAAALKAIKERAIAAGHLHPTTATEKATYERDVQRGIPLGRILHDKWPVVVKVTSSIRDTNTAQDIRKRWGKTPTQVGAM